MLARTTAGGDIRALQQLLSARSLQAEPADGPLRDALIARAGTLRIMDTTRLVKRVEFSPDGRRIASGGNHIWCLFFPSRVRPFAVRVARRSGARSVTCWCARRPTQR